MHPKDINITDFTYDLPDAKIAEHPAEPRDSSKLLISDKGNISEGIYRELDKVLPDNATLVFNDTKVIKSRIIFQRQTGAVIEIFCLEPYEKFSDYITHFQSTGAVLWKCMIGNAGKWKEKHLVREIVVEGRQVRLFAEKTEKLPDAYVVRLSWEPAAFSFAEILTVAGVTPLPPYIKRSARKEDEKDYQTVYASHKGSVAAPTAGLHFTDTLMQRLQDKNIPTLFTTLHVGAGTFKPVKSETMEGHIMHSEWMNITVDFLKHLLHNTDRKMISVGTTATRTLESIYWMGNKILNRGAINKEELKISQWEVYKPQKQHTPKAAISALKHWMEEKQQTHLLIETGIIIAPGYDYKMTKGLITNFHQPQSTLLLLVSAFIGQHWRAVYDYALHHDFRFLSYGDGCLLFP